MAVAPFTGWIHKTAGVKASGEDGTKAEARRGRGSKSVFSRAVLKGLITQKKKKKTSPESRNHLMLSMCLIPVCVWDDSLETRRCV